METEESLSHKLESDNGSTETEAYLKKIRHQAQFLEELYLKGWESLKLEKEKLEKEKQAIREAAQKIEKYHFANVVTLNIGGTHYTTSLSTLLQDKDSFLARMFSGNWKLEALQDGSFFIDRDGTNFRYILNYLRTGKVSFPADEFLREDLIEEATFYNVQSFIEIIKSMEYTNSASTVDIGEFYGTTLLTTDQQIVLNSWFGKPEQKWRLIYKATLDGFSASSFHSKCDAQGPTFVIIRSSHNWLFGGYKPTSWQSSTLKSYDNSANHFIFTLTNPHNIPPTKYVQSNGPGSIDYAYFGPNFMDIEMLYNGNDQIHFPNAYLDTTGKRNTTFTGNRVFAANEVEVFKQADTWFLPNK